MILLDKTYYGENIHEAEQDLSEMFDSGQVPQDEHGFHRGTFKLTVEWIPEEN